MRVDDVLARGGGFPELRRSGDIKAARALVPTDLVAQLAIVGTLDSVRSRLADLEAIGVTHVFLDRHGLPRDPEAARSLLAKLQQRSES
jgi:alkanesulfonate monooxygenase SsuD/methylene tetrahydromethanopterin reductase-like flavin-dependent oxidoreductase (luciferase family)